MDILKNSLWLSVVCLIAVPAAGFAYGLGGIRIMSGLNEPLDAEIPLSDIKLHELNTLRFELLDVLDDTKRKQQQRVIPHPIHLAAEVKTRDGHAYLHVTSDNPLYANCSKKSFSCYNFFRFGVLANWRSRALENRVERSFPVIPRLDRALGKVNLLSTGGEQLEAEIELLDHHLDLSHLKVRLAPKQAWLQGVHFGVWEYKEAKRLGIRFNVKNDKLVMTSRKSIKRTFSNRIQTTYAPLVLLIEAIWENGRQLKKYTIFLPA